MTAPKSFSDKKSDPIKENLHEYSEAMKAGIQDWKKMTGQVEKPFIAHPQKKEPTSILPALTDALDQLYNDKREGIHVSDLVLCPRKTLFRRLNPAKTTPTELNFFTLGKSLHQAAQDLTKVHGEQFAQEQEVWMDEQGKTWYGGDDTGIEDAFPKDSSVVAHIDIYDKKNNVPVEMKGIRKADIDQPKSFHAQQLRYYMAITGAEKGIVLYQLLMNFKDKPFKEFILSMDEVERTAEKQKLMREMKHFKKALDAKDPRLARDVMSDPELNWQCDSCKYLPQCQEWSKK